MAQTPADVKKIFPGEPVVYLNYSQQLTLSVKNDTPVAESNHNIELMLLGEDASSYSKYEIYHSDYNELTALDAYTKIPDGDKYKKVKITNEQTHSSNSNTVFYDDVQQTSFDFPSLTQNAIQHIDYNLYHKDAHLLTPFFYEGRVPLMNGSYTVVVPNEINIKYVVKNDPKGLFQFSEEKKRKETVYKWTLKNVKPIDDDFGDAPDGNYYEPNIIIYITSFQGKNGQQNYLNSLDDLYQWDVGFTKELNTTQDPDLKKIVDSLIVGKTTETDKAKSIYNWVQQSIRYVAFENGLEGFRPRQAAEVCSKRYGDCKDMSSIITQMLRIAGIKAYYTWIGTRSLPYDYTDIPLPIDDNHMISTANINGKWIFLDGTDPHATFGTPPSGIQNKEALISISDKEYKVLRVPIITPEENRMVDTTSISFTDNGIKGHENVTYYGYQGEDVYNALLYSDEKGTKDYVKSRMGKASNKFILGSYAITKVNPEENVINIAADFEIPGYGKKIGDEYYINLNLEKVFEKQVIDTNKRKVPLELEYNYLINEYHILDIPKGYKITYLPKDFTYNNDLASIKISYKIENGKVIAEQEATIKKLMIEPVDFDKWNKEMSSVQSQYKESVVLEKITN
ncbi:MAG TPA: DUF3857 domain-containing protein [Ferruginibacter sp.]|nr:DUF3857 domain-containing protein [Ferruginibacter sp.]